VGIVVQTRNGRYARCTFIDTDSQFARCGVNVRAYDPAAMNEAKRYLGDSIYYANDIYDAANDADALIVPTEWKEFRLPNWGILRKIMNNYLVVDGRNIYNREEIESYGFEYRGIGRK